MLRRLVRIGLGALALLALALGILHSVADRPIHVADGFEGKKLSHIWTSDKLAPGALQLQQTIAHSGHGAARITLHANDRYEGPGNDHSNPSERDELTESPLLFSHAGRGYTYRFSEYLPSDFPIVNDRLVIAQWKQLCEWSDCKPDNPVLALRYTGGIFQIDRRDDAGHQVLYQTTKELRGQWLNFRFVTRFSAGADGEIDAWINGEQVVSYRGVTAYRIRRGYPADSRFYFKMGLYRDLLPQPMTIYLDDYSKDQR